MPRAGCPKHGEKRCSCAMGNITRFIEPVVLYVLGQQGSSYGYELAGLVRQHAFTDSEIEPAALYRTLRALEMNGHVVSEWDTDGNGPARRRYKLTVSGERHLQDWVELLDHVAAGMRRFVSVAADHHAYR